MQVNGLNSGHSPQSHQITNCMHDHESSRKPGGAASQPVPAETKAVLQEQETGGFVLSDWLQKSFQKGKNLLRSFWGTKTDSNTGLADKTALADSTALTDNTALTNNAALAGLAPASSGILQPVQQNSPYFVTAEDKGEKQQTLWKKIRIRFHAATDSLNSRFFRQNTFASGKESAKEDLRRRSHYKGKDEEMECILSDDSYLLDSYDRKGEYGKITTNK